MRCALPAPSGRLCGLREVADGLARRLVSLYLPDDSGARPVDGGDARWRDKPWLRDRLLFFEHSTPTAGAASERHTRPAGRR